MIGLITVQMNDYGDLHCMGASDLQYKSSIHREKTVVRGKNYSVKHGFRESAL